MTPLGLMLMQTAATHQKAWLWLVLAAVAVVLVALSMRAAPASVWPGMTPQTAREFTRIGRGQPILNPNQFAQVHKRCYAIKDYAAAGHTQLTFFQDAASDHVTNVNHGELPEEQPMWLTGVCVSPQDLTAAGAASGVLFSNAAQDGPTRYQEWRRILQAGLLELYVADRKILEVQDLTHFPSDGAFDLQTAQYTQAAAALGGIVGYGNGAAFAGNRFRLPSPYPILPGKTIKCLLRWQAVLTIAVAARIKVELVGESVISLNQ